MSNWKVRQSLLGTFDNAEEDKAKKQAYLNEHIVQGGFDKYEFAEYMAEAKENGNDIDEWTLIELMDMVQDFKNSHKPVQKEKNESDEENHKHPEIIDSESGNEEAYHDMATPKDIIEDEKMIDKVDEAKDVVKEVPTKVARSKLSQYTRRKLNVEVSEGLIKKGGMFSFSYPTYKIVVEPLGWTVRRKEDDFMTLRKYLWKIYPSQYIPPLILTSKKLTEDALKKKEKYFTKFLTNVLRNK